MKSGDITFYFDPISPFAWLASTQLHRILEVTERKLVAKPILFAGLLKAHGNMGPAEIPAKRDYTFRDVMRRAMQYQLVVESPPQHPFNPLLGLRACTSIENDQQRLAFAVALMQAAWEKGLDITDTAVVSQVAATCKLNADAILQAVVTPAVKQDLIDTTNSAVEQGVFGVPSFVVDGQIFWGDDRIDYLIHYLRGQNIDEAKLAEILARDAAVQRKT